MFYFFILGCIQALIFWCSAVVIDKIWPKRADEYFFEGGKDDEKAIQQQA